MRCCCGGAGGFEIPDDDTIPVNNKMRYVFDVAISGDNGMLRRPFKGYGPGAPCWPGYDDLLTGHISHWDELLPSGFTGVEEYYEQKWTPGYLRLQPMVDDRPAGDEVVLDCDVEPPETRELTFDFELEGSGKHRFWFRVVCETDDYYADTDDPPDEYSDKYRTDLAYAWGRICFMPKGEPSDGLDSLLLEVDTDKVEIRTEP